MRWIIYVRFIKIAALFTSLIPSLVLPTDDRENSERRATQLPAYKKCYFLRLLPKQVFFVPEKVAPFPKKVYSFPETIALPVFLRKNHLKSDFSCTSRKKILPLHPI